MKSLLYKGEAGPKKVHVAGCGTVERGGDIHVPEDVAKELLERQPNNWALSVAKKPAKQKGD